MSNAKEPADKQLEDYKKSIKVIRYANLFRILL